MSIDLRCEATNCLAYGEKATVGPDGQPRWLCYDCWAAWAVGPDPQPPRRPAVDWLIVAGAFVGYVAGLMLALHGLGRLITQLEVDAGIAWLRWAEIGAGAFLSLWCWCLFSRHVIDRAHRMAEARARRTDRSPA